MWGALYVEQGDWHTTQLASPRYLGFWGLGLLPPPFIDGTIEVTFWLHKRTHPFPCSSANHVIRGQPVISQYRYPTTQYVERR